MDRGQKIFAHVDEKLLREGNIIDSIKTIEEIKALDQYKSFNEIIESQK